MVMQDVSLEKAFAFPAHKVRHTAFACSLMAKSQSLSELLHRHSSKARCNLSDMAASLTLKSPLCCIQGRVKCMAASAPFIASGGADDTVHIYNAKVEPSSAAPCFLPSRSPPSPSSKLPNSPAN